MKEFQGKTAVITGGASGIGRALAEKFASERMNVVLADIEEDALDNAVKDMSDRQLSVTGVVTNTMRQDSIDNLLKESIAAYGNVHILCNNAGIAAISAGAKGVWEIPAADWEWTMGVNFYGVLYGIQAFVPHMLAHGESSHIVNTASLAGISAGGGPYGVTKHGVLSLSEGLKRDLVVNNANIGASVLCPGYVNTKIMESERNRPGELESGGSHEMPPEAEWVKHMLATGKDPAEIADIVFNAIVDDNFYILPHPAWDDTVRTRFEAILQRGDIPMVDIEDLVRRKKAGEEL
jgi:NAD(P)-dependent dehydrogenase (short-subunit alcohol dehydrogenase family)